MAFEGLTEKISSAFKHLRSKGRLTESDIKDAMKEIRMALLEADVNFKVAKDFIKTVTEKATDAEILESLSPTQQVIKIVNEELVSLLGGQTTRLTICAEPAHHRDDGRSAGRRQNHQLRKAGRLCFASSSSAGRCSSPATFTVRRLSNS